MLDLHICYEAICTWKETNLFSYLNILADRIDLDMSQERDRDLGLHGVNRELRACDQEDWNDALIRSAVCSCHDSFCH